MSEKRVITKHVPSIVRMNEIAEEERKKGNLIKGITTRSNCMETKDEIIHFVVWYELVKVWQYVNGYYGQGEIDVSEINKEIKLMEKVANFRKGLQQDTNNA